MAGEIKIDLGKILQNASSELQDVSPSARQFFVSLAKDILTTKLTSKSSKQIANELISKLIEVEMKDES